MNEAAADAAAFVNVTAAAAIAAVQPAATAAGAAQPIIPSPQIGGGNDTTAWTGGPIQSAKRLA
jgi:hypothetical protein